MAKDDLGNRMKADYENRTRYFLPRRTYTLIRVDGKSFHTYTRGCERPYDLELMRAMDRTAKALCEEVEGAAFAFVQSDEISLLLTDFATIRTEAWFDGSLQKICSISASIATAHFNRERAQQRVAQEALLRPGREHPAAALSGPLAYFDSRAWTIPDRIEVFNYFLWRQQDASRNSISMTAQAHFDHKALEGKSTDEMQEMLWRDKGINWNDLPIGFKRGRVLVRTRTLSDVVYTDTRTGETRTMEDVERHIWEVREPPIFTQEKDWLLKLIPSLP